MFKMVLKWVLLASACLSLSGCLTTMYVMKKMNETEYTPIQVSTFSNYGLVACKHRGNVKESSRNLCSEEIQKRMANNKLTPTEYSNYEMQIEDYRQADIAAANQRLHEQIMKNQEISAQESAQQIEAMTPKEPIEVNVHHSL